MRGASKRGGFWPARYGVRVSSHPGTTILLRLPAGRNGDYWNGLPRTYTPGDTWLDVGAHYGYTAIALGRLVGPTGRVVAFEPMVSTAGCVAETRRLNDLPQVIVVPMALGDPESVGTRRLPTIRGMVDSTLEVGHGKAQRGASAGGAWDESFLVARLDWLWPRICGSVEKIDGIKIDVQGMELDVLRGMTETLHVQRPRIVVEFHIGVDRAAVLSLLEAVGYSPQATAIEPLPGEIEPRYADDRSYAFHPI